MKKILITSVGIIVLIILGLSVLSLKIYSQADKDEANDADAIVVLGASQWDGQPSPVFAARLDHALNLYQQNLATKIILTGGIGVGEKLSESEAGKNYLINKGALKENIFTEDIGRTSWQSLKEVVKILRRENLHSIILVSDGFHMMRLNKMAKDLGLEAYTSPTLNSPVLQNKFIEFKYAIREAGVLVLYLLFKI